MKIVCSVCKKVIGEIKPYKDPSETKATCTACIEKTKEEAKKFAPEEPLKDGKKITLENGLKGTLWVAKTEKEKLGFGELAIGGKKHHCSKDTRLKFQECLNNLPGEEADVSFLHTISCKIDTPLKGRRKKQEPPKVEEPKKDERVHFNCTMRASKQYIQLMFDDMAERMDIVTGILAEAVYESIKKDQQKTAQNATLSSMSGSSQEDIPIPK